MSTTKPLATIEQRTIASYAIETLFLRRCIALVAAAALTLFVNAAAQAALVFADDTFNDADWTEAVVVQTGNGGSVSGDQDGTNGNPLPSRRVVSTVNAAPSATTTSSVGAFHQRLGFTYDPQSQGAVPWIEMTLDARQFDPPFSSSAGQRVNAAIIQDGTVYVSSDGFLVPELSWTTKQIGPQGQDDFAAAGGGGQPDFSASGAPFGIGFFTTNSTSAGSSGFTTTVNYDNWTFSVVPEPSSAVFLGAAALAFFAIRRLHFQANAAISANTRKAG